MLNDVSTVVLVLELHRRLKKHLYEDTPKDDALLTSFDKQDTLLVYQQLNSLKREEKNA